MRPYLNIVKEILDNGVLKENRTGVNTLAISGAMFLHDMREGFPLLTTKKMSLKNIAVELEFFIKGLSSKKWLQERGNHIWDDWCNPQKVPYGTDEETKRKMREEDDLSRIYGVQWNDWQPPEMSLIEVKAKILNKEPSIEYPLFPIIESKSGLDEIFDCVSGKAKLIETYTKIVGKENRKLCTVQFIHTGTIVKDVRLDAARIGAIKDPYFPNNSGVGWLGEYLNKEKSDLDKDLLKVWSHMLERCYNSKCKEYQYYGAKGVFVCNRWLNFTTFRKDVETLQNWHRKEKNPKQYQLDKDYYSSNCYSPETCVWITKQYNVLYRDGRPFQITLPDGNTEIGISQSDIAIKYGLKNSKISAVLQGKRPHHKKFKFKYLTDGKIYRYQLPINQLRNLVKTLKTNPNDRRMIVSAWNPPELNQMALPPCHLMFQVIVINNTINLNWYQRSVDTMLGLPYNIASYGLLLELLAKESGFIPAKLCGMLGDVHIYENHIENAKIQLWREPSKLPNIEITNFINIFDWTYKDFSLKNYVHNEAIKFDIAV